MNMLTPHGHRCLKGTLAITEEDVKIRLSEIQSQSFFQDPYLNDACTDLFQ